jgi:regulator of extracellular matrix RemA (YlzA/DUF370 family)
MRISNFFAVVILLAAVSSCKKQYFENIDYVPLKFAITDTVFNQFVQDSLFAQIKTVIRDPALGVVEISTPVALLGTEVINNNNYKIYSVNFASIYNEFNPLYFVVKIININNGSIVSSERLTVISGPASNVECKKRVCRTSASINAFTYNNKTYNIDFEDRNKTVLLFI